MNIKRYIDDWAKQKQRKLLLEFIKKNLSFKEMKDVYVLCFPGIDCVEIFEVYDLLGIPRANITGFEKDPETAAEIESKNLGITLVNEDFEIWLQKQERINFDIISLDYAGTISESQEHALRSLVNKQKNNSFVLLCANLMRREKLNAIAKYGFYHIATQPQQFSSRNEVLTVLSKLRTFMQDKNQLNNVKSQTYSSIIRNAIESDCYIDIVKRPEFRPFIKNDFYNFLNEANDYVLKELMSNISYSELNSLPIEKIGIMYISQLMEDVIEKFIQSKKSDISKDETKLLHQLLNDAFNETKVFNMIDAARYSYISESSSPIFGDIYFYKYNYKLKNYALEFLKEVGYPEKIAFNQNYKSNKCFIRYLEQVFNIYKIPIEEVESEKGITIKIFDRIFLGSSSKIILTKQLAIEELKNGLTFEEVQKKYRGRLVDKNILKAIKAHITMGTYEVKILEQKVPEFQDEDITTINDVKYLVEENIPIAEILLAYPQFTKSQIAAYKAHKTMRERKEVT